MIRKLRMKFTVAALASMAVVLLLILGTVNIVNYRNVIQDADGVLKMLADNEGTFPDMKPAQEQSSEAQGEENEPAGETTASGEPKQEDKKSDQDEPPENQAKDGFGNLRHASAETPFETRYFSVLLDADGTVVKTDVSKIAAVDEESAQEYAKELTEKGKTKGFLLDYRYSVTTIKVSDENSAAGSDTTSSSNESVGQQSLVIFVDCSKNLSTCQMFLVASIGISVIGLLAVFLLLMILSGRIVRPYAESYEKQRRFITDAGHEIKTPLTIIDADLAVLEMELDQEEPNEWITDIQKQTVRLKDLTNDLIYLSKMEEGQVQKSSQMEFPISDVVSELAQSFQNLALANGKTLTCEIEPMLTFYGDMKGIQKLTGILLDNAVKYSVEGGKIELKLKKQGKGIQLSVSNPTEGMDKVQTSRMFDRFYRRDESRSTKTGGYGIGLSIAKAVVGAHKGKIKASLSEEGKLTVTASM